MQDIDELAKNFEKYDNYIVAYQDSEKVWHYKINNGTQNRASGSESKGIDFFSKMIQLIFEVKEKKNIFEIINKTIDNIPYMITYCQKMYKDSLTTTVGELIQEEDCWVHKVEDFMYDPKIITKVLKILLAQHDCVRNIRLYKVSEIWNSEERDKKDEKKDK